MTEETTHPTLDGLRSEIDEALHALVHTRSDDLIQKLQTLAAIESRLEDPIDGPIDTDWF